MKRFFRSSLILFLSISIVSLSGCSSTGTGTASTAEKEPVKLVKMYKVKKEKFIPEIEVSGTLEPQSETTLAAEVSGSISSLNIQEGDEVKAGQLLLEFEEDDNAIRLNYQNSLINFDNSKSTLSLTKRSADRNEESAKIALEQAEISFKNAKNTDEKTLDSIDSQIEAAKKSVEIAATSVEMAENTLSDINENNIKTEANFGENVRDLGDSTLKSFQDILLYGDDILGITSSSKKEKRLPRPYVSFHDPNLLNSADSEWRLLNTKAADLEKKIESTTDEKWKDLDYSLSVMTEIKSLCRDFQSFLNIMEDIADNTIVGDTITDLTIQTLAGTINTFQSVVDSENQGITALSQRITDFRLQSPQGVQNAQLSVVNSKNQLSQAEKNLEQLISQNEVQKSSMSSAVETSEKAVESAKNQLENVKEINELSIQGAETQYKNAENMLDQALIQLNKLTVESPVKGVVISQTVEEGNTVNMGSPLFVIAEIDTLTLRGDVPVDTANGLSEGMKADIIIEDFEPLKGRLERIYPTADPNTRQITVEISVNNKKRNLPVNVFAKGILKLPEEDDAVFIPLTSLVSQDPAEVFVLSKVPTGDDFYSLQKEFMESLKKSSRSINWLLPKDIDAAIESEKTAAAASSEKEKGFLEKYSNEIESLKKISASSNFPGYLLSIPTSEEQQLYFVKKQTVVIGQIHQDSVEIVEGISPREIIIREKIPGIAEGDTVAILDEKAIADTAGKETTDEISDEAEMVDEKDPDPLPSSPYTDEAQRAESIPSAPSES